MTTPRKKAPQYGKRFELEMRHSLEAAHPKAWVQRFTDSMSMRPDGKGGFLKVHAQTPPDLLIVAAGFAALIECKAQKLNEHGNGAIPTGNLQAHQQQHLVDFDGISSEHHGYVAVLYYNAQRGKARIHRAWLAPIAYWLKFPEAHQRVSIPWQQLDADLPYAELEWAGHGLWNLPSLPIRVTPLRSLTASDELERVGDADVPALF